MMPPQSQPGSGNRKFKPIRETAIVVLLGMMTVAILLRAGETISAKTFVYRGSQRPCFRFDDPVYGTRGVPNSVCKASFPEGEMSEYRLNNCGHRTPLPCGPKPPGVFRIVMVGSSAGMGDGVSFEQSFAGQLYNNLPRDLHRPIQLYNISIMGVGAAPRYRAEFFSNDILTLQPDLILYTVSPYELFLKDPGFTVPTASEQSVKKNPMDRLGIASRFSEVLHEAPMAVAIRHYLYRSQYIYLKAAVEGDEEQKWCLRKTPTPEARELINQFDRNFAAFMGQADRAGFPVVVLMTPRRSQVAMVSSGDWSSEYDPYWLDSQVLEIARRHGAGALDILPTLALIPDEESLYFPSDQHPNAKGHAVLAQLIERALTAGSIPQLKAN